MRTFTKRPILVEGEQTGDGRIIAEGVTAWVDPPIPLLPEHYAEESVGNITMMERVGAEILASGVFDDQTERGAEMARQMDEGTAPLGHGWGVSIEPDDYAFEVIDTTATIEDASSGEPIPATVHVAKVMMRMEGRGMWPSVVAPSLQAAAGDGEPSGVVVYEDAQDNYIERVTRLRIRAVAMTPTAAFASATLELDAPETAAPGITPASEPAVAAALTAAGAIQYARSQFEIDEPGEATPFTIRDDGTFFGHVHAWGACHIGHPGRCLTPQTSPSGYESFNRSGGVVDLDDGSSMRVAPFLFDTNHAALSLTAGETIDHYANTAGVFGFGRVKTGKHGPFAVGVLRPDLTAEQITLLKGCGQVSGDWRNGELYACQVAPRPGLGIERREHTHALAASGGQCLECASAESRMLHEIYEQTIARPRRQSTYARLRERFGR